MTRNDEDLIDPPIKQFDQNAFSEICNLGSGGCAQVKLMLKKENQKLRAIKTSQTSLNEKSSQYFKREYTLLLQSRHPAIMRLYDCGIPPAKYSSNPWLELEFLPGGTLTEFIDVIAENEGAIDNARCFIIAYGIASAVAYIHSKSVVHRDIKPDNILLDEDYEPRLADFGFARKVLNDSLIKSFPLTVSYAAPEIIEREYSDDRSDVYSFGMTLYHMRALKRPYADISPISRVVKEILNGPPRDLPENDPFKPIIDSCIRQNPKERPKMDEVAEALKNLGKNILTGFDLKSFEDYCYKIDNNVLNEDAGSVSILEKLADEGSLSAMCQLGWMYYGGIFFERDLNQALEHFKIASFSGSYEAARAIRDLYKNSQQEIDTNQEMKSKFDDILASIIKEEEEEDED